MTCARHTPSFRATRGICFFSFLLVVLSLPAHSQVQTGTPPFGSFAGGPDVVNLANLNAHWTIPVLHKPGRDGFNFIYDLSYDTSVWYPVGSSGNQTWQPVGNWGWSGGPQGAGGGLTYNTTDYTCQFCNQYTCWYPVGQVQLTNWVYQDVWGARHAFSGIAVINTSGCPSQYGGPNSSGFTSTLTDGSGLTLTVTGSSNSGTLTSVITRSDGTVVNAPNAYSSVTSPFGTDRNGNQITTDGSGHFYDTLSSTTPVLTVAGQGTTSSPVTFTYTPPNTSSAKCGSTNGVACYTVSYVYYTVATNFAVSGINEQGATATYLVDKVTLPDGSFYQFSYEPTPGTPQSGACSPLSGTYSSYCVTARISKVTLPTGGYVSYSYSGGAGTNNSGIFSDGSAATVQRTVYDGANSNSWTYTRTLGTGAATATLVAAPKLPYDTAANQTIVQFQGIYETQRDVYQGSAPTYSSSPISEEILLVSNLLTETETCYNTATTSCTGTAITLSINQRTVTTQLGGSGWSTAPTAQDIYKYNSSGGLTEEDDYDYGFGSPGALLRQTLVTYAPLNNITAFRQQVTVKDGNGNIASQTNYNYDETTPATSPSDTPQHTTVSGSRGNLTSINYPVGGLAAHFTYFDTGMPQTSKDVNNATTTYTYGSNASACGYAFPTSISEPSPNVPLSRSFTWNCAGGVELTMKDENLNTTTTDYTDAFFWRPADVKYPDGGETDLIYNSQTSMQAQVKMNSTPQYMTATQLLDGLGRAKESQLTSDPEGVVYQDTTYDSLGRPYQVYNPTRCSPPTTSCGESTWGYSTYAYDALSRPTSITLPDGSVALASYTNNTVTATDPAGKKRTTAYDSLGRLTQVLEDPSGQNYETDYGFDALGDLLCVGQKGTNSGTWSGCSSIPSGWRARSYSYDAMSRLISETNPESGTVTYGYDANGNPGDLTSRVAPAPNQTGSNSVTTTYTYDSLHRLTQKSYSDGTTPTAFYSYDGPTNGFGVPATNLAGRLAEEWTGTSCCASVAGEIFGYDAVGRTVLNEQYTPSTSYIPVNYTYDLAGNQLTATNGEGVTISYTYDAAARPTAVTSSLVDSQHPATLATVDTSLGYFPTSQLRKMTFGNGVAQALDYNPQLQTCRVNANSSGAYFTTWSDCSTSAPTGNIQDLQMNWNGGATDNGNLVGLIAAGQQSFNRTYGYDSLNRLTSLSSPSDPGGCKGLSWTYDPWANRSSQTTTSGLCPQEPSTTFTANNQFPSAAGYTYDSAGNMTYDGNHTYFYDAENRLAQVDGTFGTCSTATACYGYDAEGRRAQKTVSGAWFVYAHDLGGRAVAEIEASSWGPGYVYLGDQLLALYSNSTTYFVHPDHLGSTRLLTALDQSVVQNLDYLPFGELNSSDSGTTTHLFTGDERDAETASHSGGEDGLDHTWFRQYSSSLGRWMHPDPAGLAAVDPSNPQSWNRYAYVINNPLAFIDPFGLANCEGWTGPDGYTSGGGGTDNLPPCTPPPIYMPEWATIFVDVWAPFEGDPSSCPTGMNCGFGPWSSGSGTGPGGSGGGGSSGQVPQIGPQPTLKFKPPSWHNFTHEFLPCYGAQLTANFFTGDGLVGTAAGVALTVAKPIFGAPVLAIWAGINAFRAGTACAVLSRGYYQ